MNFNSFNFHPLILTNIQDMGYSTPTPIQSESIPVILSGKDVLGIAQTGTGKTAAFALPVLHQLMRGSRGKPRALILAPTRELAQQITNSVTDFSRQTGLQVIAVFGGLNIPAQIRALSRGVDILVACPGRLLDLIQRRAVNLSGIEWLVLDEADHMFDMGFLPGIRKILRTLPKARQTLMFSATMPGEIRSLANEALKTPVTVQIGHTAPANSVKQVLFPVEKSLKTRLLINLLKKPDIESAVVFTKTKHTAKKVARQLADAGFCTAALQGNMSQSKRVSVMNGFREGSLRILVATDIVSRGIDVDHISHVINYDIPSTVEAYIHRIGRTGRMAKFGQAFTFASREDASMVRSIQRTVKKNLEQRKPVDFD